jgi:hypothetical protein
VDNEQTHGKAVWIFSFVDNNKTGKLQSVLEDKSQGHTIAFEVLTRAYVGVRRKVAFVIAVSVTSFAYQISIQELVLFLPYIS